MGNLMSVFNDNEIELLINDEIKNNINKINNSLSYLNHKCDEILSETNRLDNKIYKVINKIGDTKNSINNYECNHLNNSYEWDAYETNNIGLIQ